MANLLVNVLVPAKESDEVEKLVEFDEPGVVRVGSLVSPHDHGFVLEQRRVILLKRPIDLCQTEDAVAIVLHEVVGSSFRFNLNTFINFFNNKNTKIFSKDNFELTSKTFQTSRMCSRVQVSGCVSSFGAVCFACSIFGFALFFYSDEKNRHN